MARSIPPWLSEVVEKLELERPELITTADIERLTEASGTNTPARVVASRLKERGWLMDTPLRGVWEYIPAEVAGAYSSADPLLPLKAFKLMHPHNTCALSHQSAAWALGLADRIPMRLEIVFSKQPKVKVPAAMEYSTYRANLPLVQTKGVTVLPPEAIITHMAQRPSAVRSWYSAQEWLPDVAYEVDFDNMLAELQGRQPSVWRRTGYLLQGMRPIISEAIFENVKPTSTIRFGTSGSTIRTDSRWKIADSALPFDPRTLEAVK